MFRFWKREEEKATGPVLGGIALGPRPWLVLGGGGLKGLTHLGVVRVLQERGFEPTGILGTSIGALVGACVAGGQDVAGLLERARSLTRSDIARIERRALWVNGFRAGAFFQGGPLREYLASVLPPSWEALETRFQTNAVELGSGRTEWFGIGARTDVSLVEAVYASAALPVFYPPAELPGGHYVDGAAEWALPVRRAAELGATGIVAVDPGSAEATDASTVISKGILALHQRVFSMMSGRLRRESVRDWDGPPMLYLRPRLEGYGSFDFEHIPYFLEEGERAARRAIGTEDIVGAAAAVREAELPRGALPETPEHPASAERTSHAPAEGSAHNPLEGSARGPSEGRAHTPSDGSARDPSEGSAHDPSQGSAHNPSGPAHTREDSRGG